MNKSVLENFKLITVFTILFIEKKALDNEVIIKQFRDQSVNANELEELRALVETQAKENEK